MDLLDQDFNKLMIGDISNDVALVHKKCRLYQENFLLRKDNNELLHQTFTKRKYCHPNSPEINKLVEAIPRELLTDTEKAKWIFIWCLENLTYGRLKKPFFPLVRTDLDVLELKEGTCGDFSHLFVSCMDTLGVLSKYVRVQRDLYNDQQDHICATFYSEDDGRWILVDPVPSYGRTTGWDVKHKDYTFIDKEDHWRTVKEEELFWINRSIQTYGSLFLAGIIFAPWIYEGIIEQSENHTSSVFVLLTLDKSLGWQLWVTKHTNTKQSRSCPIRIRSNKMGYYEWDECLNDSFEVWDEKRWKPNGVVDEASINQNHFLKTTMNHLKNICTDIELIFEFIEKERS